MKFLTKDEKLKIFTDIFSHYYQNGGKIDAEVIEDYLNKKNLIPKWNTYVTTLSKSEQDILNAIDSGYKIEFGHDDSGSYMYYSTDRVDPKFNNGALQVIYVSATAWNKLREKGLV